MSHHVSAGPSNPTGAVEVVRSSSAAATTAPVDGGGAAGAGASASTVSTGSATGSSTGAVAAPGTSGTPGANLPVSDIQQASNTVQNARADLARTTGAERRLDGFDGVGGGGGGGGEGGGGGDSARVDDAGDPNDNVAEDTADKDTNALAKDASLGEKGGIDPRATTTGEQGTLV